MLNTLGHNAQLCYPQYSLNAQYCAIVHLCIHFSLVKQLCTNCCACVVYKVKDCKQIPNSTTNLHNANESCVVLSIVQVGCA